VLGPALGAIGHAAGESLSPFQVAQPEMRRLADTYDAVCTAVTRDGNEVVLRERATSRSHLGLLQPQNSRMPLRAPFAGVFFAWSPSAQADAWFDRMEPPGSAAMREQMHQGMAFAREHGFLVSVRQTPPGEPDEGRNWQFPEELGRLPTRLITSLEGNDHHLLSSINAPVFDRSGSIAFVMSLASLSHPCDTRELLDIGKALREACDRISGFLGGRIPQP